MDAETSIVEATPRVRDSGTADEMGEPSKDPNDAGARNVGRLQHAHKGTFDDQVSAIDSARDNNLRQLNRTCYRRGGTDRSLKYGH